MPWPLPQDYNEALQSPASHFADPDLCQGQAVTDAHGLPAVCSGSVADVYRLSCPGGEWAVECFTREVQGLGERCVTIGDYLRQAELPFVVAGEYVAPGIRVGDVWYPVVKRRWVDGLPLNAFVRDNLDNPAVLRELLGTWVGMARRLHQAGVAHGDIRHDNVTCAWPGPDEALQVWLIGHDGMYVPGLDGRLPPLAGHHNYRHPRWPAEAACRPDADRFALLVVACALSCLRFGGRWLWDRYDSGDNLLFTAADFAAPDRSPLFAEVLRFPDPEARSAAARLMAAARQPPEQTPLLEEVFAEQFSVAAVPAGQAPPIRWAPPGAPPPPVRRAPAPVSLPDPAPPPEDDAREQSWEEETPQAKAGPVPQRSQAPTALVSTALMALLALSAGVVVLATINRPRLSANNLGQVGLPATNGGQAGQPVLPGAAGGPTPSENKPGAANQPTALTCAELWEKKWENLRDTRVTVTGPVIQAGWTDFTLTRMWGVPSELGFVGLGDRGRGRAQVYCVFPEVGKAPALDKGRNCRIVGTYAGTKGADKVPVLVDCELAPNP
jgi:hypothetical protein